SVPITRRVRVRSDVPCVELHVRHVPAQAAASAKSLARLADDGCPSGNGYGQACAAVFPGSAGSTVVDPALRSAVAPLAENASLELTAQDAHVLARRRSMSARTCSTDFIAAPLRFPARWPHPQ